jgi:SSS family solute:Na+ symporter
VLPEIPWLKDWVSQFSWMVGGRPLGWWPGTWGFIVCVILFIGVSLSTRPPKEKAEEFIGYLREALKKGNFI